MKNHYRQQIHFELQMRHKYSLHLKFYWSMMMMTILNNNSFYKFDILHFTFELDITDTGAILFHCIPKGYLKSVSLSIYALYPVIKAFPPWYWLILSYPCTQKMSVGRNMDLRDASASKNRLLNPYSEALGVWTNWNMLKFPSCTFCLEIWF